ncbi:MAG: hypothetical protein Q7S96_01515 [bacterium]|nr:hypothetical protein [bacterium]
MAKQDGVQAGDGSGSTVEPEGATNAERIIVRRQEVPLACPECSAFKAPTNTLIYGPWPTYCWWLCYVLAALSVIAWWAALTLDPKSGVANTGEFRLYVALTVSALIAFCLGIILIMANVGGLQEFVFEDGGNILHKHETMPIAIDQVPAGECYGVVVIKDEKHPPRIAHFDAWRATRRLHEQTGGAFGSDGTEFLVSGAILQLRRGGWFRKCTILDNTGDWSIAHCWRGSDDVRITDHVDPAELSIEMHGNVRSQLRMVNEHPSVMILQLAHHESVTFGDRTQRVLVEQYKDLESARMRVIRVVNERDYLIDRVAEVLCALTRSRQVLGRSKHAKLLHRMLADILASGESKGFSGLDGEDAQHRVTARIGVAFARVFDEPLDTLEGICKHAAACAGPILELVDKLDRQHPVTPPSAQAIKAFREQFVEHAQLPAAVISDAPPETGA